MADCTDATSAAGTITACGKKTTPPDEGLRKPEPSKKLFCNSLPKLRSLPRANNLVSSFPQGLYVSVIDGLINVNNRGNVPLFSSGQFGYTGAITSPPIVIPKNPGIQFSPPPTFSGATSSPAVKPIITDKPGGIDCEVRVASKRALPSVNSADSMARGSIALIFAGDLRPRSAVSVYLLSAPGSLLGTFDTDSNGALSSWVRLPKDARLGANVLQVNGYTPEGFTASVSVGITVRDASTATANQDITFDPDSSQLTGSSQASLNAIIEKIPVGTVSLCTVRPLTSAANQVLSNSALSDARANTTAAYLNAYGLACTVAEPRPDSTGSSDPESLVNVSISFDR
jgi:outer membrane protein OmpA-like peptidoglycan-associated protein